MSSIVYKNKQLKIEDIWDCSDGCVGNYWQYNR